MMSRFEELCYGPLGMRARTIRGQRSAPSPEDKRARYFVRCRIRRPARPKPATQSASVNGSGVVAE